MSNGIGGQAIRFGLVGLVNTAIGLSIILLLQIYTPLGPYGANAGGYAVALMVSFYLNRRWTFKASPGRSGAQAVRFLMTFAVSYSVNLGVLTILKELVEPLALAQIGAVVSYTVTFFLLSRVFVFR